MKTLQEVFDIVASHLLTQMKKARKPGSGTCVYLTKDGKRCAIGCLLTDEDAVELDKGDEGGNSLTIPDSRVTSAIQRKHDIEIGGTMLTMLKELQTLHDYEMVYAWEIKLRTLATHYNLTLTLP